MGQSVNQSVRVGGVAIGIRVVIRQAKPLYELANSTVMFHFPAYYY